MSSIGVKVPGPLELERGAQGVAGGEAEQRAAMPVPSAQHVCGSLYARKPSDLLGFLKK